MSAGRLKSFFVVVLFDCFSGEFPLLVHGSSGSFLGVGARYGLAGAFEQKVTVSN